MKQRIIASVVVFSVGFGIGLGLTWALLSKQPADAAPQATGDDPQAAAQPAADLPTEPVEAVREATPPAADAPEPEAEQPGEEPAADEPEADDPEADMPEAEAPAAKTPEAPAEEKVEPIKLQPVEEPEEDTAEPEPAPKSNAWWKGLSGKKVRIDLGKTKALTIRRGELEDGEKLEWSRRFGTSPRVGLLYAAEKNFATVHGVAVNAAGTPVAAKVTVQQKGVEVTGIIALHTQGLKVTLYPVD